MNPPSAPRVWPALTLGLTSPLLSQLGAGLVVGLVVAVLVVSDPGQRTALMEGLQSGALPSWAMTGIFLVSCALLGIMAAAAAALSPTPFRERLGLVSSGLNPLYLLPLGLVGLALGQITGNIAYMLGGDEMFSFFEPINKSIRNGSPLASVAVVLAGSVGPGIGEELMFRGYVQRRLFERWSPGQALVISSVLFSLAHLHPVHVLLTLPISFWLGYVAWRTGSTLPGMFIHAFNNAFAFSTGILLPEDFVQSTPQRLAEIGVWVVLLLGSLGLLLYFVPSLRPTQAPAALSTR